MKLVKRVLSCFLSLALAVTMMCGLFVIHSSAAVTYNAAAAVKYAVNNYSDSSLGECSCFVSRCLQVGGINIDVYSGVGELYNCLERMTVDGSITKFNLSLVDSYNGIVKGDSRMTSGDVIILVSSVNIEHTGIVTGFDEKGYPKCTERGVWEATGNLNGGTTDRYMFAGSKYYRGYTCDAICYHFANDNTPPAINRITNEEWNQSSLGFLITCDATDNISVKSVKYCVWSSNLKKSNAKWYDTNVDSWNGQTFYWYYIPLSDFNYMEGTYYVVVCAEDHSGNKTTKSADNIEIKKRNPIIFYMQTIKNGTYTLKNNSGLYMSVHYGDNNNGTNLLNWNFRPEISADQQFVFEHAGGGKYRIYTKLSGTRRVVDVGRNGSNITQGSAIDLWEPDNKNAQLFYILPQTDGSYIIRLAGNEPYVISGRHSSLAGSQIYLSYNIDNGYAQRWTFCDIKGNVIDPSVLVESVDLKNASIKTPEFVEYTGTSLNPEVQVFYDSNKLTEDVDYSVSYSNNVNVGTATVTITGKGNYTGTKAATFKITAKSASSFTVSTISDQTYTGSAITPTVIVKDGSKTLTKGTDYTISYKDNTNVGTATVTITGEGNYTGTKAATFKITAKSASDFTVSTISDQTYTGSAITPAMIVKDGSKMLTKDTDYTIFYMDNTNVGTATVTITGKGNYTGTKAATFEIVKPAPAKPEVTATPGDEQVTLTWNDIGATKYAAYLVNADGTLKALSTKLTGTAYTAKKLTSGTEYTFLVRAYVNGKWTKYDATDYVKATPFSTVVKPTVEIIPADKQVTLTWDAIDGATKYAVYRLQDDGTLKALATKLTDTEYTVKKLVNHTEYQFLVRAYVNGKWTKYDANDYVSATPAALKPLVRVSEYDGMVTLRWGAVDDATKYAAYIVNDDDSLTCVSSKITNIKYTVKKLTNGTKYRFVVRAYVGGKWTKYTDRDIVTATPHA